MEDAKEFYTCAKCLEEKAHALDVLIDREVKQHLKFQKMMSMKTAENLIRECVDRPKGVVPDSVYDIFPRIIF